MLSERWRPAVFSAVSLSWTFSQEALVVVRLKCARFQIHPFSPEVDGRGRSAFTLLSEVLNLTTRSMNTCIFHFLHNGLKNRLNWFRCCKRSVDVRKLLLTTNHFTPCTSLLFLTPTSSSSSVSLSPLHILIAVERFLCLYVFAFPR